MEGKSSWRCKFRNKKRKIWLDWSHTKKQWRRNTKGSLRVESSGKQMRGRPKNSWRRSVIKEVGRSWNELRLLAADRQNWKEFVVNLCS
jgi:hypothetical protein